MAYCPAQQGEAWHGEMEHLCQPPLPWARCQVASRCFWPRPQVEALQKSPELPFPVLSAILVCCLHNLS